MRCRNRKTELAIFSLVRFRDRRKLIYGVCCRKCARREAVSKVPISQKTNKHSILFSSVSRFLLVHPLNILVVSFKESDDEQKSKAANTKQASVKKETFNHNLVKGEKLYGLQSLAMLCRLFFERRSYSCMKAKNISRGKFSKHFDININNILFPTKLLSFSQNA